MADTIPLQELCMAIQPATPGLDPARLSAFAARLRGECITPGDDRYDTARLVVNRAIDRRPSLIVVAAGDDDVATTIALARETGLELAVRSGGHSVPGHSTTDGGILLDLSGLNEVEIDAERRIGTAGVGATAGAYTHAAFAHGFATPFGDTASVGLGGITLGGGIGWLARKRGLTIDHLLSVDLVTADGARITASETEHPDLFWALRGGGGNFGVAARFRYRLEPIGTVFGGAAALPLTREVLRGLVDLAVNAPDELTMILNVMAMPPLPMIPPELHSVPVAMPLVVWDGDPEAGRWVGERIRAIADPLLDVLGPMPYPAIYELTSEDDVPVPWVMRSAFVDELSDAVLDAVVAVMPGAPPMSLTQIRVLGGAICRVPAGATAYAQRDRVIFVGAASVFEDPAERARWEAWTEAYLASLAPGPRNTYVNFLDEEGPEAVRNAYPGETWDRLRAVKRRYDPDNLFRLNQNIAP
jgi:FAD/FMN-containing dehydrogenase